MHVYKEICELALVKLEGSDMLVAWNPGRPRTEPITWIHFEQQKNSRFLIDREL